MENTKLMSLMDKLCELEGFNGYFEEISDLKKEITEKVYSHFKGRETGIKLQKEKLVHLSKNVCQVIMYYDKNAKQVTVAEEYYGICNAHSRGGHTTEEFGEYIKGLSLTELKGVLESDQDLLCCVNGIPDLGFDGICDLLG